MQTRQAQLTDFDELYAMWQQVCDQLYPVAEEKARFVAMMQLNPDLCLVVTDEVGAIIGSILGAFDGRNGSIHRLIIASQHQQKGLGKMLISELEKLLKARGIKKFTAQIHAQNTIVAPFYEKLGFSEMNYVKTFYKDL
jgi:ribosomal protein S18 acetylase RimI-like enzyme